MDLYIEQRQIEEADNRHLGSKQRMNNVSAALYNFWEWNDDDFIFFSDFEQEKSVAENNA